MSIDQRTDLSSTTVDSYTADVLLADGRIAHLRSVRPTDLSGLLDLHDHANMDNIYRRFFSANRGLARSFVSHVCDPASPTSALVAILSGSIVGLGTSERTSRREAEISLFVDDELHGVGLGTLLLEHLAGWQRNAGVEVFVAEVLAVNQAMLTMFRHAGFAVTSESDVDVLTLRLSTQASTVAIDAADRRERLAERASLHRLFAPRSVAVVGVSRKRGKVGRETLENIRASHYGGALYAISPTPLRLKGVAWRRELAEIRQPLDLVIVAVPPADAVNAVKHAAAARAGACVVITSGFSEAGEDGHRQQQEMVAAARLGGMRLVGPNCFGLISHLGDTPINATFSTLRPPAGSFAFASQSGGVGIAALDEATSRGLGLAAFVSLGNKADVSGNDLLAAWTDDPGVEVGGLYLESFGNPIKFARIAREFSERKPLVAVFGGTSDAGRRGGVSHTAASMTPSATVRALFHRSGVVEVSGIEELVDTAALFTTQPLPRGPRVAILSNAGGIGILAADAAHAVGLEVPELLAGVQAEIGRVAPSAAGVSNPVDLGAAAGPSSFFGVAQALTDASNVDALVVVVGSTAVTDIEGVVTALANGVNEQTDVPVLLVVLGNDDSHRDALPRFPSVDRALQALAHAWLYSKWRSRPRTDESLDDQTSTHARNLVTGSLGEQGAPRWLPPAEAFALLSAFEIEVPAWHVVDTPADAVQAAETLGYPVVAKASSPDLVHKTDHGLVLPRLTNAADVDAAVRRLLDSLGGTSPLLIQPQVETGIELAIGVVRHALFGPLVMIATGGVNIDVWSDQVFVMPPVSEAEAWDAVRSLRSWPLLQGHRGQPAGDSAAFVQLVMRVARMAIAVPELSELDLNPVIVGPVGISCVDVKMRLQAAAPHLPLAAPALS
jgi:acyl-CoA synthetase (NDP forming)/GNAT superfamily N-acetyltransferase